MKKIYTVGFLLGMGSILSSFNGITSELNTNSNPQKTIFQTPLQEDNPYPIITNVHSKVVNGEEITLVDANKIPAFIAGKNQNLLLIATSLNIDVKKIYKYNDMDAYDDLMEGRVYYLKNKKSKATTPMHTTIDEKNLWEVSQKYGIKLSKLAKKNRMKPDEPLARGRVLFLQKTRPKSVPPKVIDIPIEEEEIISVDSALVKQQSDTTTVIEIVAVDSLNTLDPSAKTHIVQDGESVFTISRMYNVTMLDLKNWNNIGDDLSLDEGQRLIVGKEEGAVNNNVATESNIAPIEETTFTILPPEESANRTTDNQSYTPVTVGAIAVGATEQPAIEEEVAAESSTPETYVVQKGEFYYAIARKFGVSPQDLQGWNDNKALNPGDKIFVSNPSASTTLTGVYAVQGNSNIDAEGTYTGEILTHTASRGETVKSIAATYGVSENDIYLQNKGRLVPGNQPKNGMFIQIPIDKAQGAQSNYNEVATTSIDNQYAETAVEKPAEETIITTTVISQPEAKEITSNSTTHTVQKGETLFAISRKYSIYHKDLIKWNNLPQNGAINVGQTLTLEVPSTTTFTAVDEATGSPQSITEYHIVEKGDTLFSVSRKYDASVSTIKELNGMTSNEIKIGQKLQVK